MSTNLAKLKKGKGAPPAVESVPDVIAENPRKESTEQRALQVKIPSAVFDEFSEMAGREFGFTHGAKKQLFLKMWQSYKAQNS